MWTLKLSVALQAYIVVVVWHANCSYAGIPNNNYKLSKYLQMRVSVCVGGCGVYLHRIYQLSSCISSRQRALAAKVQRCVKNKWQIDGCNVYKCSCTLCFGTQIIDWPDVYDKYLFRTDNMTFRKRTQVSS